LGKCGGDDVHGFLIADDGAGRWVGGGDELQDGGGGAVGDGGRA
jgi:hypothetical protein